MGGMMVLYVLRVNWSAALMVLVMVGMKDGWTE